MLKYFKWIFLIMLIGTIIVLGIRFISYIDNMNNEDNNLILDNVDKLEMVYDKIWNKIKTITYRNDGITSGMSGEYEEYYLVFTKDYVSYCRWGSASVCINYKYTYKDGVIFIDSEEDFLPNGLYNISIGENKLEFIQELDGNKTIHYFEIAGS